jgi:RNA polymerase sigma factor (sigma-70 family)
MDDRTDEELLLDFYEGNDDAFAGLCCRYRLQFIAWAHRRLQERPMAGRLQLAEDLAGVTLARISGTRLRPATRWRPERGSVRAWVYAILNHEIASELRRRPPEQAATDTAGLDETAGPVRSAWRSGEPDPASLAQEHEEIQRRQEVLHQGLRELPFEQRVAVLLRLAGLTQRSIAGILGCPEKTVSVQMDKARQRLQRHVQRHLYP